MFPAFSRIWIINILLAGFVVFFGVLSFEVWSRGDEKIPEMQTGKSPEKALPAKGIAERTVPPDATFAIVAEKNLFSSSRSEIIRKTEKARGSAENFRETNLSVRDYGSGQHQEGPYQ